MKAVSEILNGNQGDVVNKGFPSNQQPIGGKLLVAWRVIAMFL